MLIGGLPGGKRLFQTEGFDTLSRVANKNPFQGKWRQTGGKKQEKMEKKNGKGLGKPLRMHPK